MGAKIALDEPIWDLSEKASSIAGTVGRLGTPMIQAPKTLHSRPGEPIGGYPIDGGDESDAAGIVVKTGVDEWSGHKLPIWEQSMLNTTDPGQTAASPPVEAMRRETTVTPRRRLARGLPDAT